MSNQVCTRYSCAFLTLETMGKLSELNINIELNPISAGVLENQDMPGGGQFVSCPNMTNDTSLESSCALLLESAHTFANLQKLNFLSQNPVI